MVRWGSRVRIPKAAPASQLCSSIQEFVFTIVTTNSFLLLQAAPCTLFFLKKKKKEEPPGVVFWKKKKQKNKKKKQKRYPNGDWCLIKKKTKIGPPLGDLFC